MKNHTKTITKAQKVVQAEKSAMKETIKNVEASIISYEQTVIEINKEITELQAAQAATLSLKKEAIEYRNKLTEIVGE